MLHAFKYYEQNANKLNIGLPIKIYLLLYE